VPVDRRFDPRIDLDVAAGLVVERQAGWSQRGLTTHALTWLDDDAGWPARLVTDRSKVGRPRSVGVRISREQPYAEAQFVLYAAGWADVDVAAVGDDLVASEYVKIDDADTFGALLDRVVAHLLTRE
jgi:hypothetical protein